MDATIRLDHELIALESEHDLHGMLELLVPEPESNAARAPIRLALVLDRSGSMGGEKLETAKRCVRWLLSRLDPADELALVDYDDEVRLLAPLGTPREAVLRALEQVWPGGSTNLSGGWLKGAEQLRGRGGKVLLLTDGLANVGITDREQLVSLAAAASGDGVGTTTIGFGDGFDEELLAAMADGGGGSAHYAPTPDAAPAIFAQEFENLAKLVAQNVSVELRPTAEVQVLSVLNDYPQVPVAGGVQLQLGDAYGGDHRRVVFALHIPRLAELGVCKIAEVVVRYVAVGEEIAAHELTIPVVVNLVSSDEAAAAQPDLEVTEQVLVLKAARAREDAIRNADGGDYDKAADVLRSTAQELRDRAGLFGAEQAERLRREAELIDDSLGLTAPASYGPGSRKQLFYDSQQRKRRRS